MPPAVAATSAWVRGCSASGLALLADKPCLLSSRPQDVLVRALAGAGAAEGPPRASTEAWQALIAWLRREAPALVAACTHLAACVPAYMARLLPGPTGERNVYRIVPREGVLCLASSEADRLVQLAAVLAVGGRAVWPQEAEPLWQRLPPAVRAQVALVADGSSSPEASEAFDLVLLHGPTQALAQVQARLARQDGEAEGRRPLVAVERLEPGDPHIPLERLVKERSLSVNTAAAGGNASLMTIDRTLAGPEAC